jgi:hypothetical protein
MSAVDGSATGRVGGGGAERPAFWETNAATGWRGAVVEERINGGRDYVGRSEPRPYKPRKEFTTEGAETRVLFFAEGLGGFDFGGAVGGQCVGGYADQHE